MATQAQVQNLASAVQAYTRPNAVQGVPQQIERAVPGMIRRIPDSMEVAQTPADNTESFLTGVSGDLRQAAAAFCAPEYWLGDAGSGNYSSLETASAPAVRAGVTDQEYYKSAFARGGVESNRARGRVRQAARERDGSDRPESRSPSGVAP